MKVILIWRIGEIFLNRQTKVTANIIFKTVLWKYLMTINPWPIHQIKCSSISVCCQITKFNACQMHHSFGTSLYFFVVLPLGMTHA